MLVGEVVSCGSEGCFRNIFMYISAQCWQMSNGQKERLDMRYPRVLTFFLFASLSVGINSLSTAQYAILRAGAAELPSMSLTVVGSSGTEFVLNETAISGLPFYREYGGFKNQLGILKGWGNYTGVPLDALCNLVGGITNTSYVRITAADNYSKVYTFAEVNGDFVTYDATGVEVPHSQPIVPIVAYYFNDLNVSSSDGPLRMALVGPEGLATNSTYWVKMVVRVEIVDEAIPELPSLTVLFPLFLVISVIAVCFKIRGQRQHRTRQSERV